jgi:hypothetical protein
VFAVGPSGYADRVPTSAASPYAGHDEGDVCVKRRVMTHALERSTSKNVVASSHQCSSFCRRTTSRFPLSSAYRFMNPLRLSPEGAAERRRRRPACCETIVFAHALVHHLFVHAASAGIAPERPHWKILVPEFTPSAEDLDSLGFVRVDQEVELHADHLSTQYLVIPTWGDAPAINRGVPPDPPTPTSSVSRHFENTIDSDGCTQADGRTTLNIG